MDINSPAQVSRVIDDTVAAANAAIALLALLQRYDVMTSVNGVHDALTAPGAQFPPGFRTTPGQVADARFAIASLLGNFNGDMGTYQPAMDNLRLDLGVLTGTG